MQRGKEVFVKENESEINSAKIKTQTYVRGGKFNNVQTTYVVYSKRENKPGYVKDRKNIIDNYNLRNRKLNVNSSELFSKTPLKTTIVDNNSSKIKNSVNNNNNYYQFSSPKNVNLRNINRVNYPARTIDNNEMNRSQNTLPINRTFESYNRNNNNYNYKNNIVSDRSNYSNNYRNTNFNYMNRDYNYN